jgi:hypothetical protein
MRKRTGEGGRRVEGDKRTDFRRQRSEDGRLGKGQRDYSTTDFGLGIGDKEKGEGGEGGKEKGMRE